MAPSLFGSAYPTAYLTAYRLIGALGPGLWRVVVGGGAGADRVRAVGYRLGVPNALMAPSVDMALSATWPPGHVTRASSGARHDDSPALVPPGAIPVVASPGYAG